MSKSISLINLHLINTHLQAICQPADPDWQYLRNNLQPQDYLDIQYSCLPSVHSALSWSVHNEC